jgi:hypothetical protein
MWTGHIRIYPVDRCLDEGRLAIRWIGENTLMWTGVSSS